ncbi:MaoC family dehydratase [Peptococcus simiae]|uniref:MaoC family dehydratase n=1 Tax=Peptococcus simiae TaxID=1643805 RepID=UPI003980A645
MASLQDIPYDQLTIGDTAELSKTMTDDDVQSFAEISLDRNPLHLDDDAARRSIFGQRVAHGILSAGLISAVIGTQLPGKDTIYLEQTLKFTAPVFIGDQITAKVTVTNKNDAKHIIQLKTQVTNQDGKMVIDGTATVVKK